MDLKISDISFTKEIQPVRVKGKRGRPRKEKPLLPLLTDSFAVGPTSHSSHNDEMTKSTRGRPTRIRKPTFASLNEDDDDEDEMSGTVK